MKKRFLAVLTAAMLLLTSASAFADAPIDWREPYPETVDVHIALSEPGNAKFAEGEDYTNNLWTKLWKERYNVNVIVDWTSADYGTKLNLSIASNALPDMFPCDAVQFDQLKTAGQLQELNDVYEKYASPSIKELMESNWDIVETAMDGDRIMAMPQLHYGYECETTQIWARKDWMVENGITEFKTVEDVENAMRTFMEKNGAQYGILVNKDLDTMFRSAPMFHAAPKIWVEGEDGTLEYGSIQPAMKDVLSTWAKWYSEGLIRPDFASLDYDSAREDAYIGKTGLMFSGNWNGWNFGQTMVENQGDGSYFTAYDVPSIDGEKAMMPVVFPNYTYNVVRADYEHPEVLIKLIDSYCDVLNDSLREGTMTLEEVLPFNTNDMHHITGPFKVQFVSYTDCMDVYNAITNGVEEFHSGYGPIYYNEAKTWADNKELSGLGRYLQMAIPDGGMVVGCKHVDNEQILKDKMWGLKPQAILDYGSTLDDLLVEGFTQIIMGTESIEYFDVLVESWKMAGGEEVTKAVNEMYGNR